MTEPSSMTVVPVNEPDLLERFKDDVPVMRSYPSGSAERRLQSLVGWPGAWIGEGVDTPDASAIVRAEKLLRVFRKVATNGWTEPHVAAATRGEISLEWWCRSRKLTVYVAAEEAEALLVWGADVDSEMDDLPLRSSDDVGHAWNWLNS